MGIRRMQLPYGWYPHTAEELSKTLALWAGDADNSSPVQGIGGIVPHAGWHFSGELAYQVMRQLTGDADTVIVAGGHLGRNSPVMGEPEDEYETPLGLMKVDTDLRRSLGERIPMDDDQYVDNTVEVQMPMVHYRWPDAKVLPLRLPPSEAAVLAGKALAEICRETGRRAVMIGSTDLTHYGPSYNFMPRGAGNDAVKWVQEENDGSILNAMTAMDVDGVLYCGNEKMAACSAGAAAGTMALVRSFGIEEGILIDYRTSLEKNPSESFVGYGGVVYRES